MAICSLVVGTGVSVPLGLVTLTIYKLFNVLFVTLDHRVGETS